MWVSEGYDFNPFQDSRLGLRDPTRRSCRTSRTSDAATPATTTARRAAAHDPLTSSSRSSPRRSATPTWRASSARSRAPPTARTRRSTRSTRAGWSPARDIDEQVDPPEWNELRAQVAGQHARAGRGDRRPRRRQPERLRQGAEADRRASRATTTCSATTRAIPIRRKRRRKIEVKVTAQRASTCSRAPNTCSSRRRGRFAPRRSRSAADAAFRISRRSPHPGSARRRSVDRFASARPLPPDTSRRYPTPMKFDAEPGARDRRAAQAGERIHHRLDASTGRAAAGTARAAATGTSPDAADRGRAAGSSRRG